MLASGLDVTVLQPTAYMQNLLPAWRAIAEHGIYRVPYRAESRISLIDLEDVADAAATVLLDGDHSGATYQLVGTPPLSQTEVAATLSDVLGQPVQVETESIAAWEACARAAAMADYARDALIRMFRYYDRHGLIGNSNTLRWLLGRKPHSLAEFARRVAANG
jgi:uncharacterized protein YbjT (DUF2867 family)